ncbi:unnamed protein product [Fusarium graminearum]|uniref:Uncharacterized protein n=1 Tax=Gibberella zeae TaxID=5518 RepID=A0A8H3KN95_GIBZA|nr:unnamed protein product [Fusarium graminearum]CAG2006590.1 unnamed protein product [Fusarium graminearum]CZS83134.1 unnamed protein product [Fusarium graminearum]
MDVGLQRMVSGATTSKSSDRPNNSSPLLCPASSDYAKKLENESLTLMQEKYPSLVDIDAVDVLKVIGSMQNFLMRNTQQGLTELCISIAFPLVILQCRTLTTLLASLSSLEEDGGLGSNYLDPKYSCVLTRLEECFDWRLESVWNRVFSHWKSKAKDGDWIDRRTKDLIVNLAEISPMLLSVEEAFTQIDQIAGTTLFQITRNAERTFHMFDTGISECTAKAQELRIEQEATKYLSPTVHTSSRPQSWTSGASPPSGGIVQRTSFGRGHTSPKDPAEPDTIRNSQRRWRRSYKKVDVSPERAEDHWTGLLNLIKSPVVLILIAAMPLAIYSTILCESPDRFPALDSNFYSTLSQCVSSFAGLYVIVKPILRSDGGDGIETSFPKVFYTMLAMSLLTSVASAAGYAWSPPASIPLTYVSGLTLNIATLLIIQDSGNQIKEGYEKNLYLTSEVHDLEVELAAHRGQY